MRLSGKAKTFSTKERMYVLFSYVLGVFCKREDRENTRTLPVTFGDPRMRSLRSVQGHLPILKKVTGKAVVGEETSNNCLGWSWMLTWKRCSGHLMPIPKTSCTRSALLAAMIRCGFSILVKLNRYTEAFVVAYRSLKLWVERG